MSDGHDGHSDLVVTKDTGSLLNLVTYFPHLVSFLFFIKAFPLYFYSKPVVGFLHEYAHFYPAGG